MSQTVTNIVDPLSSLLRDALATASSFIPLKSLRHGYLEELFLHAQAQSYLPGQRLFEYGQFDGNYVYLLSGELGLTYRTGELRNYSAGQAILPLAHTQPRAVTAQATTDVLALLLPAPRLQQCLAWSQITDYMLSELAMQREHDGQLDWIGTVLSSNLFFKVPPINAANIIPGLTILKVKAGERPVVQGQAGHCCYFLKHGEARILKQQDGREHAVALIRPGRCFGEDALIDDKPRNATVEFLSDGELLQLDRQGFLSLLREPDVAQIDYSERDQRILIDVRTDAEYAHSRLNSAANVPLSVMAMKKKLLRKDKPYLFYCDSGIRSRAATHFLSEQGYNVVALRGGFEAQGLIDELESEACYMLREGCAVKTA